MVPALEVFDLSAVCPLRHKGPLCWGAYGSSVGLRATRTEVDVIWCYRELTDSAVSAARSTTISLVGPLVTDPIGVYPDQRRAF